MNAARWSLAAALLAGDAYAGGDLDSLAVAALVAPEVLAGGSLIGPPEGRATWTFLGDMRPYEGDAMVLFSTGDLGLAPIPGEDLGAVGVDDDRSGCNFTLAVPEGARSLRFAARFITAEGEDGLDRARVLVQGDPVALDPWRGGDFDPMTPGLRQDAALAGTLLDGARAAPWVEVVVPVDGGTLINVRAEVEDGGSPWTDSVLILDALRFEASAPQAVLTGRPPRFDTAGPDPYDAACGPLVVSGANLSSVERWWLDCGQGDEPVAATVRSDQEVALHAPGPDGVCNLTAEGPWGPLRWDGAVRRGHVPPRITSVVPRHGSAGGMVLLSVEGRGFAGVQGLRLGGHDLSATTVRSCDRIELLTPAGLNGAADLELLSERGSTTFVEAFVPSAVEAGAVVDRGPTLDQACSAAGAPLPPAAAGGLIILVWRRRRC